MGIIISMRETEEKCIQNVSRKTEGKRIPGMKDKGKVVPVLNQLSTKP
jgi:hypothetical protein